MTRYGWRRRLGAALLVAGLSTVMSGLPAGRADASGVYATHQVQPAHLSGRGVPVGLSTALQRSPARAEAERPGLIWPSGVTWSQQAELTPTGGASSNRAGWSVAVSGDTAVVGTEDYYNPSIGAAYVFVRSGAAWTQQAMLTARDAAAGDDFGYAVAISGTTVIVGALYHNGNTGAAYVFVRHGTIWTQQAELTARDGAPNDFFGGAVAISGSTAAIGAFGHNGFTGATYVFVRSGTTWTQQAELTAKDGVAGDEAGASVAISGGTVVSGAPHRNTYTGAAYVFARSGTTWSQQAELTASDGASADYFGSAVAISGDTAVIGAPQHPSNIGTVYIYVRNGTGWSTQAELSPKDGASFDFFGSAVAVSGGTAVIGAYDHGALRFGEAYMFARRATTWYQQAEVTSADAASYDEFGFSVAVSGATAVIGAPSKNNNTGTAYVFVRT